MSLNAGFRSERERERGREWVEREEKRTAMAISFLRAFCHTKDVCLPKETEWFARIQLTEFMKL